jgi:hypothetical protein
VTEISQRTSAEQVSRIHAHLVGYFPGNEVVVIDSGIGVATAQPGN